MEIFPLTRYQDVLWALHARVDGVEQLFLLDTAAGLTTLDRAFAERLGIRATGHYAGQRMTGETIELDLASEVEIAFGERVVRHPTVGVFDLARMLPPDWPPLGGAIGLPSFDAMRVTLDFRRKQFALDADPRPDAREMRVRPRRDGPAVDLFAEIRTPRRALWFEIDTGNTGPVIVSQAAVDALSWDPVPTEAELDLAGVGPVPTDVVLKDIRYDGNLGAPFFAARPLTLDLAAERAWLDVMAPSGRA